MKQFIKSKIFNLQNLLKIRIYSNIDNSRILRLINLLKTYDLGHNLIRLGENNDGGYLIPKLSNIKSCHTIGVGNTIKFEKDLGNHIKIFLADKSVKNPKLRNAKFEKKFISSFNSKEFLNINNWIQKTKMNPSILKIDAEGSEYEIIHAIQEKYLKNIKILVLELHNLHLISNEYFYSIVYNALKKIKIYFDVCHLHPNNNFPLIKFGNLKIPRDLEVTLLNKKFVKFKKKTYLPHRLDKPTIKNKKAVFLPKYFF